MSKPDNMPVRVFHQHFADVPGFAVGRGDDFGAVGFEFIDIVQHDAEPGTGVALAFFAKKDLHVILAYAAEGGWVVPFPLMIESQF